MIVVKRCCDGQCGRWIACRDGWVVIDWTAAAVLQHARSVFGGREPELIYLRRPVRP